MSRQTVFVATLVALSLPLAATAQGQPGEHFLEQWDLDGDGQVSLAEATEKRGDVFVMLDSDEDGLLNGTEYDAFDALRAEDQRINHGGDGGPGKGTGKGPGNGTGKGPGLQGQPGQGQPGQGKGPGGWAGAATGMERGFNDLNGDGAVSKDEFLHQTEAWLTRIDRDGDGTVTQSDFGR